MKRLPCWVGRTGADPNVWDCFLVKLQSLPKNDCFQIGLFLAILEYFDGFGNLLGRHALAQGLHALHELGETRAFGGADPFELQPFGTNPQPLHLAVHLLHPLFCPMVGVDVVTVADMASADQNDRSALRKSLPDEFVVYAAGTHGAHEMDIGRILQAGDAGVIGPGIGTPIAGKGENLLLRFRLEQGIGLRQDLRR